MHLLGIDIGGSAIKAAPVNPIDGCLACERLRIPTPAKATPEAVLCCIDEIIRHFAWQGAVGCGVPGVVRDGVVRTAANIDPSWVGTDIIALLGQRTGCPVSAINDADAAGLAEMSFGAGRKAHGTTLVVTAGTGLGTALFRGDTLVPNCELGHLLLDGRIAEHYASAAAISREGLSLQDWAGRFGAYLRHLEELFWPDLIIVGGEISRKFDTFSRLLKTDTPVVAAQLGNDAGIVGAAIAARHEIGL
jgi:polyphosphate glucokinase